MRQIKAFFAEEQNNDRRQRQALVIDINAARAGPKAATAHLDKLEPDP